MMDEMYILDMAMNNSYDIIISGESPEDIIESDIGFTVHNPSKPIRVEDLESMIQYFTDTEEYEKCIEIKEKMDSML